MNSLEILALVTGMLSGLALFLYGMNVMSESLTQAAGGRMSGVIDKITANRLKSWGFGAGLAAFVQSSATTVMAVGLVSSGIVTVKQVAGMIIGANFGTTATAWLLSLNSLGGSFFIELLKPSSFTPFLAVAGVVILMFAKSEKKREIAKIVVGFSIMMIGMTIMGKAVEPMQDVPAFKSALLSFTNPVISFVAAVICTLIIQSSAGTIGILQALAMTVGVTYGMAIPLVCGAQAGTCLTAVLVSLSTDNNGKRAALVHLYYNLLRNIPFLIIFTVVSRVFALSVVQSSATAVGIAMFHTLINVVGTIIFLPLSGLLVKLAMKTIPYSQEEKMVQKDTLTILDPIFLANPAFALDQAGIGTGMLGNTVKEVFAEFLQIFGEEGDVHRNQVRLLCARAERYTSQLDKYYLNISERRLQDDNAKKLASLRATTNDYAEICKKLSMLIESVDKFKKTDGKFSASAKSDLELFGNAVQEILDTTVDDFELRNVKLAETIRIFREVVTDLHGKISKKHVRRLHRGECRPENNILFTNICLGYERIIDRCDSIAGNILIDAKEELSEMSDRQYEVIKQLYTDKYSVIEE